MQFKIAEIICTDMDNLKQEVVVFIVAGVSLVGVFE